MHVICGQQLSASQLLGQTADSAHTIRAFVNESPYSGDPRAIPLAAHVDIVVEYGPPYPATPPPFVFPVGP